MALQGTFDILDFSEVLELLAEHELTGRLHVRSRSFAANLFFESGQLAGADQSEHATAGASGDVRGRLEEVCFEMLETERGNFEFQPGKATSLPGAPRHPVGALLDDARQRLAEWRELQGVIPSLELQPRLVLDLSRAEVTIDRDRWRLLTAIDGRRNLRAIGRILGLSDFDVCRVVRSLLDEGIVELEGLAALAAGRDAIPTVPAPAAPDTDAFTIAGRTDRTEPAEQPAPIADPELLAGPLVVADDEGVVVVATAESGGGPETGTDTAATGAASRPAPARPSAKLRVPGARRAAEAESEAVPSEPHEPTEAGTDDDAAPADNGPRRGRLIRIRSRHDDAPPT